MESKKREETQIRLTVYFLSCVTLILRMKATDFMFFEEALSVNDPFCWIESRQLDEKNSPFACGDVQRSSRSVRC